MTGMTSEKKHGLAHRLGLYLSDFRRDERGGAIIFTLFLIVMMLLVAGYAIDTMRFENKRARLQATLDRAVLAATDLGQALEPVDIVQDYFDKAGLLDQITNIQVTQALSGRTVEVTATLDVQTMFMKGVDTLVAPASGAATETITDVEIVLVLDVSGSMRSNSKIQNLRNAARDFVSTVLQNDDQNRMSIAIVPFNAQVNLGPTLRARYNVTDLNGIANSNCIDLPSSVFAAPGISPTLSVPQSGYFDASSATTIGAGYIAPQAPVFTTTSSINDAVPVCKVFANNIVRLPNRNITQLQSQINGLTADGDTSINLGMKWGLALLDPGTQPIFTDLISAGSMAANLAGRPYAYDRDETLKVIVLMTDGEQASSFVLNNGYRSGPSPIYRSTGDGRYSIRFTSGRPPAAGANEYWVPHLCISATCVDGTNTAAGWAAAPYNSGGGVVQQTWPQVWSAVRMNWVAWQLYARALGTSGATQSAVYNNLVGTGPGSFTPFRTATVVSTMDTQLQDTCTQARDNGVVVFGIAFEAPTNGETQIFNCSSTPSHYYDAQGLEIATSFSSIASQINALKLINSMAVIQ
ncbi:MAG: TadE/TadG family protein [Rhodobacterales bacterium]|nr:TadE/TadG family protein [Rhodobacterales bacterium]